MIMYGARFLLKLITRISDNMQVSNAAGGTFPVFM